MPDAPQSMEFPPTDLEPRGCPTPGTEKGTTPLLRLREALDDMLKRVSKRPNAAEIWPKINLTLADWRAIHRSLFGE